MSDHSPEQQEFAIRLAAVDVARKRVAELTARRIAAHENAHELTNKAAEARDAVKRTAGAVVAGEGSTRDAATARKTFRELSDAAEVAEIELEGISDRVRSALEEQGLAEREAARTGARIAELATAIAQEEVCAAFVRFCDAMRHRHRLARLTSELASKAAGQYREPFDCTSPRCAAIFLSADELLSEYRLTDSFAPDGGFESATVGDLLELELPQLAEAAE